MLSSISKEQEFLNSLRGKLTYKDYEKNLYSSIAQADTQKKDNLLTQLHDIVQKAVAKGVKTESQIVTELRSAPDLAATYENLDRDCESHHIKTNLAILAKTKEIAKTPEEILNAIGQKQEFLTSLHGNFKYSHYQPSLLNSIDQAFKQQKDMVIDDLHKATMRIFEHKIISDQELMKHLKATEDPHMMEKTLRKICEDHHIAYVNDNLHKLENEEHVKIGDKLFSCKLEYIKHEIENPAHDFACTPRVTKIMQQYEHKVELEMQREMSDPSMSM